MPPKKASSIFVPIGGKPTNSLVPKSKKYEGVSSTLDTGLKARLADGAAVRNARHHKTEHFQRISSASLVRLLGANPVGGAADEDAPPVMGVGPTALSPVPEDGAHEAQVDCLILDLRDTNEFEACRISGATTYPVALLHRANHPFSAEILTYANKQGRLIVIYDNDERISTQAANLMFEKGIDNVCVLKRGLGEFAHQYPELVLGELPEQLKRAPPRVSAKSRHAAARAKLSSSYSDTTSVAPSLASERSVGSSAWR